MNLFRLKSHYARWFVCIIPTGDNAHLCTACSNGFGSDSLELFVCVCTVITLTAAKTTPKTVFMCNLLCQWLYCYFSRQQHLLLVVDRLSFLQMFTVSIFGSLSLGLLRRCRRNFSENPTRKDEASSS